MTVALIVIGCLIAFLFLFIIGSDYSRYRSRVREARERKLQKIRDAQRNHNDKCAVVWRAKEEYEAFKNGAIYFPSIEATRCTCWRATMTDDEYRKQLADLIDVIQKRRKSP